MRSILFFLVCLSLIFIQAGYGNLIAHWPLEEGTGITTTAAAGSPEADGTLVEATWITTGLAPIDGTGAAVFSNVTTTGNVTGQWAHRDVGISSNAAEPLYIALSNANGSAAIAAHDDPAAATIDAWTEWIIPLQAFADQGVNLSDVDTIAIGLGTKAGLAASGGSETMYFDDIRLYRR